MGNTDLHRRLACDRLTAPWIIDRPVNRAAFDTYVETQLAPTLKRGDKSARAAECLRKIGAWFLFLPAYRPDLNPSEMAFAKLKAHLRAANARTFDTLATAIGDICRSFDPSECWNYLKAAGYASD